MPPATEFNELSNVIITFMDRIEQLEKEIKKTKESMQLDVKSFEECLTIKQELVDIKQNTMILLENAPRKITNTNPIVVNAPIRNTRSYSSVLASPPSSRTQINSQNRSEHTQMTEQMSQNSKQSNNQLENRRRPSLNHENPPRNDQINKNKQHQGSFGTGRTGPRYNFRGTPKLMDIYVGRCMDRTTCNDVINHCEKYLFVKPNACVELNCKIPYTKSFKLTVDLADRDYLLRPENWPFGVYVRKFYTAKYLTTTEQIQEY